MIHPDGSFYEGNFKNGKRHGEGIIVFSNLEIFVSKFKKGELHGEVIIGRTDGNIVVCREETGFAEEKIVYPDGSFF